MKNHLCENSYISFVVAARNDDYGGNFLHRMQVFINILLYLWEKYKLSAELIIVEWNPPEDKPRLKDALNWPENLKPGTVRIIEVPGEIHKRLPNVDTMPIHEFIAKNVGIRRAKGEYILSTNADIIFTKLLIKFLASKRLSKDCFYRVDRYDVEKIVPTNISVDEQLCLCVRHYVYIHDLTDHHPIKKKLPDHFKRLIKRHTKLARFFLRRIKMKMSKSGNIDFEMLGLSGCPGDFFLAHRKTWYSLFGYPEFYTHAHIDSYMCAIAVSAGLRQIILPQRIRIYHQEHGYPFDFEDLSISGQRPITDFGLLFKRAKKMLRDKKPMIFNDSTWGLGNEILNETQPRPK